MDKSRQLWVLLVSDSNRLTLRQEVMQRGDDEVSHKQEVERKPQRATDDDPGQETITFHPSHVKAMRLISDTPDGCGL